MASPEHIGHSKKMELSLTLLVLLLTVNGISSQTEREEDVAEGDFNLVQASRADPLDVLYDDEDVADHYNPIDPFDPAEYDAETLASAQKPTVHLRPHNVETKAGHQIVLRCQVTGTPKPTIRWLRGGLELFTGDNILIKNRKRGSKLKILRASQEDDGVYQCWVRNVAGQEYDTSIVVVEAINTDRPVVVEEAEERHEVMCEETAFCLNGGTCYFLRTLGTKFCRCTEEFMGSRCQHHNIFAVVHEITNRSELSKDRTMTITGIAIAVLFLAALCIAAYCLAKQKKEDFLRHKAEKDKLKAQIANGVAYQPVNQVEAGQKGLPGGNPLELRPRGFKTAVTQTDSNLMLMRAGDEEETSLIVAPNHTTALHNQPPTRKQSDVNSPNRRERLNGMSDNRENSPRANNPNKSVVNAIVESDKDSGRHNSSNPGSRTESALGHHPKQRFRQNSGDSSRGSRGSRTSRDSKGNISLDLDQHSEYDNQASDMEVQHESEVDLHGLDASGDEVQGKHAESMSESSESECSSSDLGEEAAIFEKLRIKPRLNPSEENKKNQPNIWDGYRNGPTLEHNNPAPPTQNPHGHIYENTPNNYAFNPYAIDHRDNLDNRNKVRKHGQHAHPHNPHNAHHHHHHPGRGHVRKPSLQERIRQELQDDTDATPV